jgi:hypothetical protein
VIFPLVAVIPTSHPKRFADSFWGQRVHLRIH